MLINKVKIDRYEIFFVDCNIISKHSTNQICLQIDINCAVFEKYIHDVYEKSVTLILY